MAKKDKKKTVSSELPRGLRDLRGDVLYRRDNSLAKISKTYEEYGFSPLQTPVMEYADSLGKFLPDVDRPEGGVFGILDDNEKWLAMRYDLTAPLARFFAHYQQQLPKPFKRYQIGSVFRNEKPGPGRYREFTQCDADIIGSDNVLCEAELISVLAKSLENLGVKNDEYLININSRIFLSDLLFQVGLDGENNSEKRDIALRAIDKLDRLGLDGVKLLLGKGRKDPSGDFTKGAELSDDQINLIISFVQSRGKDNYETFINLDKILKGEDAKQELENIKSLFEILETYNQDIPYRLDPAIIRGLGYYTGIVFEAELTFKVKNDKGKFVQFGSVAGGGRYNNLISRFTNQTIPAVGVSIGIDRLLTALESRNSFNEDNYKKTVLVTAMDKDNIGDYIKIVNQLREAGIKTDIYTGTSSMKAQMKYADKIGAPIAVIQGSEERDKQEVIIKDLLLGKSMSCEIKDHDEWKKNNTIQRTVPQIDLVEHINKMFDNKLSINNEKP